MSTRPYQQRLRAVSAEETRRRILDAMYGQLPVFASVDALAREAGVARSTVYLLFGSRAGLFDALAEDVLSRAGLADLVRAVKHPEPLAHLRGAVRANTRMFAGQRDALWALRSIAHSLYGTVDRVDRDRLGGLEHLAGRLHDAGLLRVTVPVAVDTLWLLTSFDAFDLLFTGRGLPVEEVAERLTTMAERALLLIRPPPVSGDGVVRLTQATVQSRQSRAESGAVHRCAST